MSKAKVSLSAVTTFRKNADNEKVVADALNATLGSIDKCVAEILKERQKIDVAMTKTSKAIISVGNKISIIKNQIAKLEDKLAILRSKLAATKPTITVTHTEEVGTDEEGNPIYSSYTTEEPNPEYVAIENEIASVESELSEKRAKLAKAESIKAKLEATKAGMQKMIETLDTSKKELLTAKTSLQAKISQISKCSASAISSLIKAEKAIQKYLNEKVKTVTKCVVQSSGFNFGDSTLSIEHKTLMRDCMASTKEESRIDWSNPNYDYAQRAVDDIKKYYNNTTKRHLYESCHIDYIPKEIKKANTEQIRVENEALESPKSKFSIEAQNNLEELLVKGLLNSSFIYETDRSSIYQVKFPFNIGVTEESRSSQNLVETPYLTIVIGIDAMTQERIISTYPGRCSRAKRYGIW